MIEPPLVIAQRPRRWKRWDARCRWAACAFRGRRVAIASVFALGAGMTGNAALAGGLPQAASALAGVRPWLLARFPGR